jgi:hypothetical protein
MQLALALLLHHTQSLCRFAVGLGAPHHTPTHVRRLLLRVLLRLLLRVLLRLLLRVLLLPPLLLCVGRDSVCEWCSAASHPGLPWGLGGACHLSRRGNTGEQHQAPSMMCVCV